MRLIILWIAFFLLCSCQTSESITWNTELQHNIAAVQEHQSFDVIEAMEMQRLAYLHEPDPGYATYMTIYSSLPPYHAGEYLFKQGRNLEITTLSEQNQPHHMGVSGTEIQQITFNPEEVVQELKPLLGLTDSEIETARIGVSFWLIPAYRLPDELAGRAGAWRVIFSIRSMPEDFMALLDLTSGEVLDYGFQ